MQMLVRKIAEQTNERKYGLNIGVSAGAMASNSVKLAAHAAGTSWTMEIWLCGINLGNA
jgi:hypothetical protein